MITKIRTNISLDKILKKKVQKRLNGRSLSKLIEQLLKEWLG